MIKHNQDGAVNGLVISFIITIVLLIGALAFGGWALQGRQDYKNNVDNKVAAAVDSAKQAESTVKDQQFAEEAKNPLKTYTGPEIYGSMLLNFPKTWSGYVDDSAKSSTLIDGYFAPGVVPAITDTSSVFALHVQVLSQSYVQSLQTFSSVQKTGNATIQAYALPKLPKIVGIKLTGQLDTQSNITTTMVVLPLRSQTLEISTQGNQFLGDFNNTILPNFSFSP